MGRAKEEDSKFKTTEHFIIFNVCINYYPGKSSSREGDKTKQKTIYQVLSPCESQAHKTRGGNEMKPKSISSM